MMKAVKPIGWKSRFHTTDECSMEVFIIWIAFSIIAGAIASNKGRHGWSFFILALLLSPLIGIPIALIIKKDEEKISAKMIQSGENKKCQYCAEIIKIDAIVCRYCGRDLPKELLINNQ